MSKLTIVDPCRSKVGLTDIPSCLTLGCEQHRNMVELSRCLQFLEKYAMCCMWDSLFTSQRVAVPGEMCMALQDFLLLTLDDAVFQLCCTASFILAAGRDSKVRI